ncbi:FKBP-type peptidyl-prolyl cis-trans isomerase [Halosquirtibacter xylanolyticus]|uniref:FKBP-type peptidyl-prolyl cis-trans isomerase n=1 Tax=Halosquirtibacter xylanolyticus TaxID=3374599 RepID=UPI0037483DBB|nr:FKBP-type peptidyl-prolyl cis-trans isomerase [Prolixibacteraceae bacterium]
MKLKNFAYALTIGGAFAFASCQTGAVKEYPLTTQADSTSYAIGVGMGKNLENAPGVGKLNADIIAAAFKSSLNKGESKLTEEESQAVIRAFFTAQQELVKTENIEKGKKYLEENKTKEGVITTESGLQYKVVKKGDGAIPASTDKVKVHYTGRLLPDANNPEGKVFDSSIERGEPIEFDVTGVIPGWTEALQLMPVGSEFKVYIPSELAYGERGAGGDIAPNSTLVFDIQLLDIVTK